VPLVYISGVSGAGKSAVCDELCRRGYEAHDIDRDGIAVWVDRVSGAVTPTAAAADRSDQWLEEQEWRMVPARVEALAERGRDQLVFLCGAAANEPELWPLFSKTVFLIVDDETLRDRLATRTTNDFGKSARERDTILAWNAISADVYRESGSELVDATRPLDQVVDDVLRVATS
jgi:adenylate kinase family enzyme